MFERRKLITSALLGLGFGKITNVVQSTGPQVQRSGIVRVDAAGVWTVLSNTAHRPFGVTGVTCGADGRLIVHIDPVESIASFHTTGDEAYAGLFAFGTSAGLDRLVITIRKPSNGVTYPCSSAGLRLPSSNIQVSLSGTALV
jgi:hypothetical protein